MRTFYVIVYIVYGQHLVQTGFIRSEEKAQRLVDDCYPKGMAYVASIQLPSGTEPLNIIEN